MMPGQPPGGRPTEPSLGFVITPNRSNTFNSAIASLATLCGTIGAKLVVARAAATSATPISFGATTPSHLLLTAPAGTSEADLRRLATQVAGPNVLVYLQDAQRAQTCWAEQLGRGWCVWCREGGRISPPMPSNTAPIDSAWSRPYLSVVVPAYNAAATIGAALRAIVQSELPRQLWELVVVDDGSTDDTPLIAAQYADKLVRLPNGPHGPGYARNRGFEMTLGSCVAFVNADVMLRPQTLRRFYEAFKRDRSVGAVFGSYDTHAASSDFVSQYFNLVQHYSHQRHAGDAATFWSACGAVRAAAFEQAGCFDEWHFRRRQLEDLELGQRIKALGHRVQLRPEIQVSNLRHRTLRQMLASEIFDRAIPWMRLVNRAVSPTRVTRGMRSVKKVNIALTWLGVLLATIALAATELTMLGAACVCFAVVAINDSGLLALFRRERGWGFACRAALFGLLNYLVSGVAVVLGFLARHMLGEPHPDPVTQAFSELDVKMWPPVPHKRLPSPPGGIPVIASLAELVYVRRQSGSQTAVTLEEVEAIDVPPNAPLQ